MKHKMPIKLKKKGSKEILKIKILQFLLRSERSSKRVMQDLIQKKPHHIGGYSVN